MFVYEKKLQYPVRITRAVPAMAARIISQYGGPDGELGASLRYLSQRYSMPCGSLKGLLTDIGVEELGHLEIVGAMVYQLTRGLSCEDLTKGGFDAYFVDHGTGVYPTAAAGCPLTRRRWPARAIPSPICMRTLQQMLRSCQHNRMGRRTGNPARRLFCA